MIPSFHGSRTAAKPKITGFRRGVPFIDTCTPLAGHEQWSSDLATSRDGTHPGQAGYGLLAWLVLHHGWSEWMRLG